jgi:hypothetical protein
MGTSSPPPLSTDADLLRPEVALALRQRLNEVTEELENLKASSAKDTVEFERMQDQLTIARSDRKKPALIDGPH